MVTFDSVKRAMSGDFQSLGWCCRDVRVQLNNTLNLVTYLQVQLLELMDENQQLKAQLEMCSEVKSPIKLKEAPRHFPLHKMSELPDVNIIKMEMNGQIKNGNTSGEPSRSPSSVAPVAPVPVPVPVPVPPSQMPPQVPQMESTPHPLVNGNQPTHSPMETDRPELTISLKVSDVLSIPLKPKLAQPKLHDAKREIKVPQRPSMEGIFKCDKCPMSFPTAEFLSFHQPTHSGKRKGYHVCPVCDAMFVVKGDLSKHLAVHPDIKQYVCPVCNKSYTSKNNYKLHVKVHTGEGLYPCTYCGKSFHTENHLNVHLRTHTGERPYECSYCQKSFTQKSGLVNHTRLHTGEKPFMCPLCPKAFTQKSNLNFHLSKHHPPQSSFNANALNERNDGMFTSHNNQFTENECKFSNDNNFSSSDNQFTPRESH